MPAAAFAVSGRARVVSSWLNLGERLGVGADDQPAAAWHPSQCPAVGGSIRGWGSGAGPSWAAPSVIRRNAGGLRHVFHSRGYWAKPPAAEVSALVSEGALRRLR
jgi:hypothetical protein